MTVALDASLTLSWCFEDEVTPRTEVLLEKVGAEGAVVPALWALEVANGLLAAVTKRRITGERAAGFAEALDALAIEVDPAILAFTPSQGLGLAREYGLTPYDSAYVEVAVRMGLPLACNDEPMQKAARQVGVEVL